MTPPRTRSVAALGTAPPPRCSAHGAHPLPPTDADGRVSPEASCVDCARRVGAAYRFDACALHVCCVQCAMVRSPRRAHTLR